MSEMLEILKKRRSIRKFERKSIEKEKINQLIQSALLSPTSKNLYSWEFIVVDDRKLLEDLSKSKPTGAGFLKEAPLAFVVMGDEEVNDVWIEDASIATIILQLAAEYLGLGSCWIQIRNRKHSEEKTAEEYIKKLLGIPESKGVEAIVAIGYPDEEKAPKDLESLKYEKVYRNKYNNSL